MLEYIIDFLASGFVYPGITAGQLLLGISLGIIFGAIWFTAYWTPILMIPRAWLILASGAFISWIAVSLIQIPLQLWAGQVLIYFLDQESLSRWILLAAIPQILFSGLVQEGAKLIPVIVYWWRNNMSVSPRMGLITGAVAGLGLGVFEAIWAHNRILSAGWSWELVRSEGLIMLAGFWERFFTVALHIAMSAIAGYGLAKGKGWKFYFLAAAIHSLANYGVVLIQAGIFTTIHVEIYAAVIAVLATWYALRLRWKGTTDIYYAEYKFETEYADDNEGP